MTTKTPTLHARPLSAPLGAPTVRGGKGLPGLNGSVKPALGGLVPGAAVTLVTLVWAGTVRVHLATSVPWQCDEVPMITRFTGLCGHATNASEASAFDPSFVLVSPGCDSVHFVLRRESISRCRPRRTSGRTFRFTCWAPRRVGAARCRCSGRSWPSSSAGCSRGSQHETRLQLA